MIGFGKSVQTDIGKSFLITGKNKADVVEEICNSGDTGPAAYVAHHAQNVELFMDKGAAAYIEDPNKKMS